MLLSPFALLPEAIAGRPLCDPYGQQYVAESIQPPAVFRVPDPGFKLAELSQLYHLQVSSHNASARIVLGQSLQPSGISLHPETLEKSCSGTS